eukprot:5107123-Amphidinium_carterae.1
MQRLSIPDVITTHAFPEFAEWLRLGKHCTAMAYLMILSSSMILQITSTYLFSWSPSIHGSCAPAMRPFCHTVPT